MDFSKSEFGYFRKAHRDRETRVISFLIYLNTIDENQGGSFEVYKSENGKKDLGRFPDALHVKKTHSFPPKAGQLLFFYLLQIHTTEFQNFYLKKHSGHLFMGAIP